MIASFDAITWPLSSGCLLLTLEGKILAVNPFFRKVIPAEMDVVGQNIGDLVDTPREKLMSYLVACSRSRQSVPGKIAWRLPGGELREFSCSGSVLPPTKGSDFHLFLRLRTKNSSGNQFIALNRSLEELRSSYHAQLLQSERLKEEVLKREEAERAARKSEENFRTLFDKSADALFLVRPDSSIADVNEMACRRYKYTKEELLQMDLSQIDSPEAHRHGEERKAKVAQEGILVFEVEHLTKDGQIIPVEANVSSIVLNGEPVMISTCRDITERKKAEATLADEKERLAVTLRSIGDGVIVTDVDGRITMVNKVAECLTGWSHEDAQGKPLPEVFSIIHEKSRAKGENPVEKVLRTGRIVALANHTALIRRDGVEIIIADSAAPIRDLKGSIIGVVLVFRDITAQYRTEQEMQKMQKFEALEMLAGGLAHDFNNILTSILGNVSLVKMQLGADHKSFDRLTDAEKATRRATELTQQLLTFARGGAPIKKAASIAEIAKETCRFAISGSTTRCSYTIPSSIWSVEVDKGQMSQVFNNLVLNAVHAMPRGGTVRIDFENVTVPVTRPSGVKKGEYVKITFADEGVGIPEEHLAKIFEPYYTTKEGGSGLGLAIVLSIINRHDGYIEADSKPGQGTVFTLYVPALPDCPSPEPESAGGVKFGEGRILIMDDEELIRDVVGCILMELGYEVGYAKDGQEALVAYTKAREEKRPYDAVIMDLTIPGGMGGKDAVRTLHAIDPGATVIVSSGYSTDPIMADYEKYGFCGVVTKPYNANDISEVVNSVLTKKREARGTR